MNHVTEITDATFETEVLKSELPVMVYFWAPWCGPCRMISPVVEAAAEKWAGRMKFVKVNTDQRAAVAGRRVSGLIAPANTRSSSARRAARRRAACGASASP